MIWIAPSEKDGANDTLEKRLRAAADQLRANSGLNSQQYSTPVLGLTFLRLAEVRFAKRRAELDKTGAKGRNGQSRRRGSRVDDPTAYHAEGVLYLPEKARFDTLLNLPEGADVDVHVALPPTPLVKGFKRLVGPMFREVATLLFQIQNLRRTRDLLPRLLSGQVDLDVN